MQLPYLIVSDKNGNIFEVPDYLMCGQTLQETRLPSAEEIIPMPYGSDLYQLPGRKPIGYDHRKGKFTVVREYEGTPVFAVAAFVAPAYLQIYRSAFQKIAGASRLPLYCYTAVGWKDGQFYVASRRVDADYRQDLSYFHLEMIENSARRILEKYPKNRLVQHLIENCVFKYGCPAARNFSLSRWECPLPTSPGCNASCVGCISEQRQENGVQAPQDRITFVPTVEEIVEIAVPHLENAPRAIVSFGQGCEGEPLLAGDVIAEAIRTIRKKTKRGIINLNTNASRPEIVEKLCAAGLDSIRVSVNSFRKAMYDAYYRPRNYQFADVLESIRIANKHRCWVSLNYLVFPGFTDHPLEMQALEKALNNFSVQMIQTRNLNIDPDWYIEELKLAVLPAQQIGIPNWLNWLQQKYPDIKIGYFNPPEEEMGYFRFKSSESV